jgi:hypothetical protein
MSWYRVPLSNDIENKKTVTTRSRNNLTAEFDDSGSSKNCLVLLVECIVRTGRCWGDRARSPRVAVCVFCGPHLAPKEFGKHASASVTLHWKQTLSLCSAVTQTASSATERPHRTRDKLRGNEHLTFHTLLSEFLTSTCRNMCSVFSLTPSCFARWFSKNNILNW